MGNYITSSMTEKQKKMQKEMAGKQMNNMIRGQERMQRTMIANQMAMAKNRFWWMNGFGSVVFFGLIARTAISRVKPHLAVVLPLAAYVTLLGYTWDFAYYTKAKRIHKMAQDISSDQKNWFVPLMPPE